MLDSGRDGPIYMHRPSKIQKFRVIKHLVCAVSFVFVLAIFLSVIYVIQHFYPCNPVTFLLTCPSSERSEVMRRLISSANQLATDVAAGLIDVAKNDTDRLASEVVSALVSETLSIVAAVDDDFAQPLAMLNNCVAIKWSGVRPLECTRVLEMCRLVNFNHFGISWIAPEKRCFHSDPCDPCSTAAFEKFCKC